MNRPRPKCDHMLALLADGPATTGEVAAELGLTVRRAGARLRYLWLVGDVKREEFPMPDSRKRYLWEVA